MNDPNHDPFASRAALVEEIAKKEFGEDHWGSAMRALERKVADGSLTQADIIDTINRPNAPGSLFYDGISNASEQEWRRWRDSQPRRRERIERAR